MKRSGRLTRLKTIALGALLGAGVLLSAARARAEDEVEAKDPSYGLLQMGLHLEGGLGVYQVFGGVGMVPGVYPRAALELELGSMFSIPIVGRFKTSLDEGTPDVSEVTVSAGVNFRLRGKDFPVAVVLGAGARFGSFSARPELLSLESSEEPGGLVINGFPITPEGTFKVEVWLAKMFVIKVGGAYAPIFIGGTVLHSVEESLALAFVL
jgi:hypothetical protein